jgi:16S rRNA (uracil1498-N3)-methyltransferase
MQANHRTIESPDRMSKRFFVDQPIAGEQAVLAGPEAHHLAHVMRAAVGDEITLFDGSGREFRARIERVGRNEIETSILEVLVVDRELAVLATLAVALPKGDRQAWLVEKAVELGVTRLVPVQTARGVAQPVEKALERLRRGVIEAAKQCGRNRLMEIATPQTWTDLVASTPTNIWRGFAHPGGQIRLGSVAMSSTLGSRIDDYLFGVGPEGGFTDEEVAAAQAAGWQSIDLGPRILRVETAAILLAASVMLRGG